MINKTQSLGHLDGKPVHYSTITSQFPDVFVNRKRNTGEIIVTTDTDQEYGMHHIYAGGEHIACGYGFATPETRDDLVYIQETYIGTFNYFNDAYIYFNKAYEWTYTYMLESYAYCLDRIEYNSYFNTTVDENNNEIKFSDDYSYILEFDNKIGQISLSYNVYPKVEISVNKKTDEVLLDLLKEDYDNLSSIEYTGYIKYIENQRYGKLAIKCSYFTYFDDNGNQITEINNFDNNYKDLFTINIPKNKDSKLCIEYVLLDINNNEIPNSKNKSNTLSFVWVYPIYAICANDISNINKNVLNNAYKRFINYKKQNTLYIDNIEIEDTYSTDNPPNRIYMLLPNTLSPKFYMSLDTSKRGDLEGIMCLTSYIYNDDELNDYLKKLKHYYNYYCSSYYYIEKNIRLDVTW